MSSTFLHTNFYYSWKKLFLLICKALKYKLPKKLMRKSRTTHHEASEITRCDKNYHVIIIKQYFNASKCRMRAKPWRWNPEKLKKNLSIYVWVFSLKQIVCQSCFGFFHCDGLLPILYHLKLPCKTFNLVVVSHSWCWRELRQKFILTCDDNYWLKFHSFTFKCRA